MAWHGQTGRERHGWTAAGRQEMRPRRHGHGIWMKGQGRAQLMSTAPKKDTFPWRRECYFVEDGFIHPRQAAEQHTDTDTTEDAMPSPNRNSSLLRKEGDSKGPCDVMRMHDDAMRYATGGSRCGMCAGCVGWTARGWRTHNGLSPSCQMCTEYIHCRTR